MFNKKINLLLITLVFILSISTVAAFDATTVDDIETSDSEEPPSGSSIVDDVKSVSGDNYSLEAKDFSMYYKNGSRYEVRLTQDNKPLSNASLIIRVSGINYTRVTDENGIASLAINLNPGNYSFTSCYNGLALNNNINVLSTVSGYDIVKIFKNDTQYYASFLDKTGIPLANSDVTFNINGIFYTRKTNESGVARLNINLIPSTYIITAISPTGQLYSNTIQVIPSINGSDITKLFKNGTQYYACFKNVTGEKLANTNVTFNINGVFYTRQTDDDGVAKLNINLSPSTYIITAINPVNNEKYSNSITVLPTIVSSDIYSEDNNVTFRAVLLESDGCLSKNTTMLISVDGEIYNVTTDENGTVSLDLNLSGGHHKVLLKDLSNGLYVANTIDIIGYYSEYGVSPDGETIIAIGRPSASGELSKYGYKFYKTILERLCPYCGSTELYWGIFWAGNETANYGVFPVTGNKEAGSAEGHIFCAHCDADWSIFGNNHGSGLSLTVLSESVPSTKEEAYILKNGEMIYS